MTNFDEIVVCARKNIVRCSVYKFVNIHAETSARLLKVSPKPEDLERKCTKHKDIQMFHFYTILTQFFFLSAVFPCIIQRFLIQILHKNRYTYNFSEFNIYMYV